MDFDEIEEMGLFVVEELGTWRDDRLTPEAQAFIALVEGRRELRRYIDEHGPRSDRTQAALSWMDKATARLFFDAKVKDQLD